MKYNTRLHEKALVEADLNNDKQLVSRPMIRLVYSASNMEAFLVATRFSKIPCVNFLYKVNIIS